MGTVTRVLWGGGGQWVWTGPRYLFFGYMLSLETEIAVDFLKTRFFPIHSLFLRILSLCFYIIDQNKRRRVQRVDSAILRINLYLLDNAICFPDTYPLDSDIRWMALSIWPQLVKTVTVNSTVRWINLHSVVNTIGFSILCRVIYPVDSAIQRLNKRGLLSNRGQLKSVCAL